MFTFIRRSETPDEIFMRLINTLTNLTENLPEIIGRVLSEGNNNYSRSILAGVVLNMTHYMYNGTDFLPGVPAPLGLAVIA